MPDDILDAAQKTGHQTTIPDAPLPPQSDTHIPSQDGHNTPSSSAVVESILETTNPEPIVRAPHSSHSSLPKKGPPKGLLLGLIALLLIVLPVGVFFISQQNQQLADVRSRASGNTYPTDCTNYADPVCRPWDYFCFDNDPHTICGSGRECSAYNPQNCPNCQGGRCCTNGYYPCTGGCCKIGNTTTPPPGDDDNTNPTRTPTPTTGNTPTCQNIKIYKGNAQVTNPSTLRAGDVVTLAVKGNLSPTKAHFRVNGGSWTETTTKNAANEHTLSYTIPEGVTDFVIEGEVFTNGAWH